MRTVFYSFCLQRSLSQFCMQPPQSLGSSSAQAFFTLHTSFQPLPLPPNVRFVFILFSNLSIRSYSLLFLILALSMPTNSLPPPSLSTPLLHYGVGVGSTGLMGARSFVFNLLAARDSCFGKQQAKQHLVCGTQADCERVASSIRQRPVSGQALMHPPLYPLNDGGRRRRANP